MDLAPRQLPFADLGLLGDVMLFHELLALFYSDLASMGVLMLNLLVRAIVRKHDD